MMKMKMMTSKRAWSSLVMGQRRRVLVGARAMATMANWSSKSTLQGTTPKNISPLQNNQVGRRYHYHSLVDRRSWIMTTEMDSSRRRLDLPYDSQQQRAFASSPTTPPITNIRIVYATTGGTAQLFGMQLAEALESELIMDNPINIEVQSIGDYQTVNQLWTSLPRQELDSSTLYLFLLSTTGVGEPTASAKAFYQDLQKKDDQSGDAGPTATQPLHYAIFGLGNKTAHPNHYNVISKQVEEQFQQRFSKSSKMVMNPILPLTLGDDGDCIDDDFDKWQDQVVEYLKHQHMKGDDDAEESLSPIEDAGEAVQADPQQQQPAESASTTNGRNLLDCPGARSGKRLASEKYPFLKLEIIAPDDDKAQEGRQHYDLLDTHPQWYHNSAVEDSETKVSRFNVLNRRNLNPSGAADGLCELELSLTDPAPDEYVTGDHFVVYPRNPDVLVQCYEERLLPELNPHAIVSTTQPPCVNESALCYRYPRGLSVHETLSFCVDLNAVPSPQFVRLITNSNPKIQNNKAKIDDYKQQVASSRRTALDLILEYDAAPYLALEDYLYNLPPLLPRYYSIASSPHTIETKKNLLLTYRPVRYMTSLGHLREGVCTSFMNHLTQGSTIIGQIRHNPGFRLPLDPHVPIAMIAGGCGVAPIRSMLEERLMMAQQNEVSAQEYGKSMLFLGFRDPDDVAYRELIQECLAAGTLGEAYISTATSAMAASASSSKDDKSISWHCGNVTTGIEANGEALWQNFEDGGHTYLCGGARNFGAAVGAQVVEIIQKYGDMSVEDASAYLRAMISEGRFQEDLAN